MHLTEQVKTSPAISTGLRSNPTIDQISNFLHDEAQQGEEDTSIAWQPGPPSQYTDIVFQTSAILKRRHRMEGKPLPFLLYEICIHAAFSDGYHK